jgi:hypothetical protein
MKVAWLQDDPGYVGGAELTCAEFKAAAPEGVEVVDVPWDKFETGFDVTVVHNHFQYHDADLESITGRVVRYYHDVRPQRVKPDLAIFCSPLQRDYMGLEGVCIPPALNLSAFKPNRQHRRNGKREGTCSIAQWRNPGKGAFLIEEWAEANGPVTVYGEGEFFPRGPNIDFMGPLDQAAVAQTLWEYERFVFLPFEQEPYCRSVVEAWAAGCEVVTNDLIGARHWIANDPDALTTAADDFWQAVLDF